MISKIEGENIVRLIQSRDEKAFRKLFDSYYQLLYAYARKFVEEDIAHDVVQDLFATIWQKADQIHIRTSVQNYLISGVRNNCLHWLEKQKVRKKYINELTIKLAINEINFYTDSNTNYNSLIEAEIQGKMQEAVSRLSPQCRKIFIMSRMEGRKNREIAEELNISVKTVEKHLSKSLKKIKGELKEYLPLIVLLLG